MRTARLVVAHTWEGAPVAEDEWAVLDLALGAGDLRVDVDAPWHGDPPPPGAPGPTPGLWEFEVVELFLLGDRERYLELELGPHGHHLALQLRGRRNVEAQGAQLAYTAERRGARWRGRARVPRAWLPPGLRAANAYALHGAGRERRHLAAQPVPGPAPDFHRLDCFRPLGWGPDRPKSVPRRNT